MLFFTPDNHVSLQECSGTWIVDITMDAKTTFRCGRKRPD